MGVDVEFAEPDELNDSAPAVETGEVGSTGAVTVGMTVPTDTELPVGLTTEELG